MKDYNKNKCILIVSHSNFLIKSGGVEKFLRNYTVILNKNNIHYINIFPIIEVNKRTKKLGKEYFAAFFDSKFKGVWSEDKITDAIYFIASKESCEIYNIQLHHLHGWNLDILNHFFKVTHLPIYLFIHDLQMICPSMFQPDANKMCMQMVPNIEDKICNECPYKDYDRIIHTKISLFLSDLLLLVKKVYVPSDNTRAHFLAAFPQFENITVIRGHLCFDLEHHIIDSNEQIRIAYLGSISEHKGYKEWNKIIDQIDNNKYKFYYFGAANINDDRVNCINVDDRNPQLKGMAEQLKLYNIDISFLWSKSQETYCYTYYEASEAGSYILTNKYSGNICDQVNKIKNGKTFDNIFECIKFLKDTDSVNCNLEKFRNNNMIPTHVKINDNIDDCFQLEKIVDNTFRNKRIYTRKNIILSYLYKLLRV